MVFPKFFKIEEPKTDSLQVGSRFVPLLFVHHPRARRYLLRLCLDGVAKVAIPRRGNISAAREFIARNIAWLEQQFQLQATQPKTPAAWRLGAEIHFRGQFVKIEALDGVIHVGPEQIKTPDSDDFRPVIQKHLLKLAKRELLARVQELARIHAVNVVRVSVRNQKSRWRSCSRKGTFSLKWRLIQTPDYVRDYIIFHELAHRKQMNHSNRFWAEVERLCPDYLTPERWLK